MPTYDYICGECKDVREMILPMSRRNEPTEEPCPKCGAKAVTQKIGSGGIGDAVRMGLQKPPAGFNEVLRNISKVSPNNTMKIRD